MNYLLILTFFVLIWNVQGMKEFKDHLKNTFKKIEKERETETKEFVVNMNTIKRNGKNIATFSVRIFNRSFLFIGGNLLELKIDHQNLNYSKKAEILSDNQTITSIQVKEHKNTAFITLILSDGLIKVITFQNDLNVIKDIQTIATFGDTSGVIFFNNGTLYLLALSKLNNRLSQAMVYEWTRNQFNFQKTLNIEEANTIKSFTDGNLEIILIFQKNEDINNQQKYCNVYTFDGIDFEKIQRFEIDAQNVVPFKHHNYQYVAFIANQKTQIYFWDGIQLMFHNNFTHMPGNLLPISSNKSMLFLNQNEGNINFYRAVSKEISLDKVFILENATFKSVDYFDYFTQDQRQIAMIGSNDDRLEIYAMEVRNEKEETVLPKEDALLTCLTNLDTLLMSDDTDHPFIPFLKKKVFAQTQIRNSPQAAYSSRSHFVENNKSTSELLEMAEEKYNGLKQAVENLHYSEDLLVINGKLVAQNLVGDELSTKDINFRSINDKKWTPNEWLSYTKNQTFSGYLTAPTLNAKQLIPLPEAALLNDLVVNNRNVELSGNVEIEKLTAPNIQSQMINDILMDDVITGDKPIKGKKTFDQIDAESLNTDEINNEEAHKILEIMAGLNRRQDIRFAPQILVNNLEVENIDGVNWNDFRKTVFRMGVSDSIEGNLILPHFGTKYLEVETLNGDNVKDLMTVSTDQTVYGSFEFTNIFTSNITANKVNGLSLVDDVLSVYDSVITGPVIIDDLKISGDLILNYTVDNSTFMHENQHIFGTNESDLLQIYAGKVKIFGDVYLNNLQLSDTSTVFIDDEVFTPEFEEKYWTKNTNQVIPVMVEVNSGITTPQLFTRILNNFSVNDYMVNSKNGTLPTDFLFENVTIMGNVYLNDTKTHSPNLKTINEESVKINGNFVITGKKNFTNTVKVNNLISEEINGVKSDAFVTNSNPVISSEKIFENIVVNGDFISNAVNLQYLNEKDLADLQIEAININESLNMDFLNFTSITVENLYVTYLNGMDIDEYQTNITNMYRNDVIDRLIINGNAVLDNLTNTLKINGEDMETFYANALKLDDNDTIHKNVRFEGNVHINHLEARMINNINFPQLTSRILYKNGNQNITAHYVFKDIKARNIITPSINEIIVQPLVDTKSKDPQFLYVPEGIKFNSVEVKTLVSEDILPCNINDIMTELESPSPQSWSKMNITGNVTLLDDECSLKKIFDEGVVQNAQNIISAHVTFSNITAENLIAEKNINDVDLEFILLDALYSQNDNVQNITGLKTFDTLAVYSAVVKDNADIPVVNKINITSTDENIISRDEIGNITITGKKIFYGGLQTNTLETRTLVDVVPENLVTLDNPRKIPEVVFDDLTVNNLYVNEINGVELTPFVENILRLHSPTVQEIDAVSNFNDISIPGVLTTHQINNINMEDVVFDDCVQNIDSAKTFTEDIHVIGNMNVEMINGYLLSDLYEKAMLKNQESRIDANVIITKPSVVNSIIETTFINGFPLQRINQILNSEDKYLRFDHIDYIKSAIENNTKINYENSKNIPSEIMYLENVDLIELNFMNTLNAHIFHINDVVLMNVIGQEVGSYCGLPERCLCPMQYTMQVAPELSVHSFSRETKRTQRVFSYNNDDIIIHFITNSMSYNSFCRTEASKVLNEYSHLTWHKLPKGENPGGVFSFSTKFTGYISSVEYFTIDSNIYVIIAKYYDPMKDSYFFPCEIYKFNDDRTNVQLIQTIPSYGLWNLHLFFPQQGPVLVMGMKGDPRLKINDVEETRFMRFDVQNEQFIYLRSVKAYGSSSSIGVIIKDNSFIALAHEAAPVLLFKYNLQLNNYFLFQILPDREPILGLSKFYIGEGNNLDAYICVVSDYGLYSIYTYRDLDGWQRKFNGKIHGLKNLIPFTSNDNLYLFAPSQNISSILNVVKFGSS